MADFVYQNRKGETVMPYWVFKELGFEKVMKSLARGKNARVISRRERRVANGTVKT